MEGNRKTVGLTAPTFQERVAPWMNDCFGPVISADKVERNHRFLEEALELVQACGASREDCLQLVDYVYGRPAGERSQEVGGVMVTLAALCLANSIDMHEAAEVELARVWTKIEQIRAKQAAKPRGSVLPISPSYEATPEGGSPAECSTCGGTAMVDLSGFGDYGVCEDCPGAAKAGA